MTKTFKPTKYFPLLLIWGVLLMTVFRKQALRTLEWEELSYESMVFYPFTWTVLGVADGLHRPPKVYWLNTWHKKITRLCLKTQARSVYGPALLVYSLST